MKAPQPSNEAKGLGADRALLNMAMRVSRLGAWRVDLPGRELTWSEEVSLIHETPPGFAPDTEAGINFYAPEFREGVREEFENCARHGVPFDGEKQIITARGNRVWVRVLGEAVRDQAHNIVQVQGAIQDISRHKAAEAEHRALAERLMETLESITDAFIVLDQQGQISFLNREAERVFGRDRNELQGRNLWTECPDLVGATFEQEYRRAETDRKTAAFEEHFAPFKAWFAVRIYPSASGMAVYFRDVTAAHCAEEALRASEQRFRILFTNNPQPMWAYDVKTQHFLAANAAAVRRYGYAQEEFLAMTVRDLIPAYDSPELEQALAAGAKDGRTSGRFRHRKKDGTIIDVETSSESVVLDGREARLVLANDVTEQIRSEREARRANRALRMLTRCNEALARATNEAQLLTAICETAVKVGGFRMAWVGFAENDALKRILPQAHAGAEDGYLGIIRLSWAEDHPAAMGPAARAIRTGVPTVEPDLADPKNGFPFADAALARGYRSVVCLPLREGEASFGLLALYSGEKAKLAPNEMLVLKELADDLAFGLITLRARAERRKIHDAVLTLARGISLASGGEFFQGLTLSLTEAVGAQSGFVAKLDSREPGIVRTLAAVENGGVAAGFSCELPDLPLVDGLWVIEQEAWRRLPHSRLVAEGQIEALFGAPLVDASGQSVGAMFVHFAQPLKQPDFVISILKIFATRAAAEIQRQASDARTREQAALLDKARDAIAVRDLDHHVTYWNQSAERLYGWTKSEVIGRSVRGWIYPNPAEFDRAMETLLLKGDWTGEIAQVAKDGKALMIEARWTLVRDENGTPWVLAFNTDISERIKLQQQFFRAQRLESIGTLAGGIAHDLNNLLAPIVMGVDLLRREKALSARSGSVLDSIKRSADRGANLVKQVLSFARGAEGDKVNLDLRQVVAEVESLMANSFPKNITVESHFAPDLSPVSGNATQLNQVLVNLCVNARDAMPQGGRIRLTVHESEVDEQSATMNRGTHPGRFGVIEVTDTGSGMSKEVIERIFEPFYTTKEFGKGTGLGLATAMGIVRGHGGFLSVYSEVGKGSTFKVYLPAQIGGVAAQPNGTADEEMPRGDGELVLLVDDELSIREVTQRTLESFGYRVIAAEDGADAISRYAEHRGEVAVVLTDMMMPVMDGVSLSIALKRIDPTIKIVAASGLSAHASLTHAANLGIGCFLAKPYSASAMLKQIKTVLGEKSTPTDRPPT